MKIGPFWENNKTENAVQSQDDEYEWHAKLNDKYTLQDKLDYQNTTKSYLLSKDTIK